MGLWFTAILPGIDRWSKRFFLSYFTVFLLCCLSSLLEAVLTYYFAPGTALYIVMVLECVILAVPLPMLTVYLLHCCGESMRGNKLMRAVLVLMAVYFGLLASTSFVSGFSYISPDNQYHRGPLYPLLLLPLVAILLLNFAGTLQRRERLSRKVFLGFLIAMLPMTVALIIHLLRHAAYMVPRAAADPAAHRGERRQARQRSVCRPVSHFHPYAKNGFRQ